MQLLADYFPLLLFFVAFKWQGIYVATAVAIAASVAQLAWFHWRGKTSAVHWLSFAIIVVFGGATLLLQDETFIKWKPTVLYALFGVHSRHGQAALSPRLSSACCSRTSRCRRRCGRASPGRGWRSSPSWRFANWYVAFHFPTDTWVNFKVWGGIGLFLLFALAQGLVLARHVTEPSP